MTRSAIWTFFNLLIIFVLTVFWLDQKWLFLVISFFFIFLITNPDKLLIYFMKARVYKKKDYFWVMGIPRGSNIFNAEKCLYSVDDETFTFEVGRKKIFVERSEQCYLLFFLFIKKIVNTFPVNIFRFIFLPIAVLLYFYQIVAKVFLVAGDKAEEFPSLVLNRDILTLLRV